MAVAPVIPLGQFRLAKPVRPLGTPVPSDLLCHGKDQSQEPGFRNGRMDPHNLNLHSCLACPVWRECAHLIGVEKSCRVLWGLGEETQRVGGRLGGWIALFFFASINPKFQTCKQVLN